MVLRLKYFTCAGDADRAGISRSRLDKGRAEDEKVFEERRHLARGTDVWALLAEWRPGLNLVLCVLCSGDKMKLGVCLLCVDFSQPIQPEAEDGLVCGRELEVGKNGGFCL